MKSKTRGDKEEQNDVLEKNVERWRKMNANWDKENDRQKRKIFPSIRGERRIFRWRKKKTKTKRWNIKWKENLRSIKRIQRKYRGIRRRLRKKIFNIDSTTKNWLLLSKSIYLDQ